MATARPAQVAESSFSFLHMELVQMALGPSSASGQPPTTSQLQHASRKIEAIGFQVGVRLIERYTKDRPRFTDTLEIIKFICKDFWMEVYKKQVDKLQTNNRVSASARGAACISVLARCVRFCVLCACSRRHQVIPAVGQHARSKGGRDHAHRTERTLAKVQTHTHALAC